MRTRSRTRTKADEENIQGWKAIAEFLGQPMGTVQRWAKSGLPVERKGRFVTTTREKLNRWLGHESGSRASVHVSHSEEADLVQDLRSALAQARKRHIKAA